MGVTIESNSIRGELLDEIIEKVVRDMYATLTCVYGPFGKSSFHNNGGINYTKDGKNLFQSYFTTNEVGNIIQSLMLEAIKRQERLAGDGTTTVSLLYCVLTILLRKYFAKHPVSEPLFRKVFDSVIDRILADMETYKVPVIEDSEDMMSLIYTATQNKASTEGVFDIIREAKGDTFVAMSFNSFSEEIRIERHDKAVVEGKPLFILGKTPKTYPHTVRPIILYVDGLLDFRSAETFHLVRSYAAMRDKDVIIFCSGATKGCNEAIGKYNESAMLINAEHAKLGNPKDVYGDHCMYIYGIKGMRGFSEDEKTDLTKLIYNSDDTGSLTDSMVFEQNILRSMERNLGIWVSTLDSTDPICDALINLHQMINRAYEEHYQLDIPMMVVSEVGYALSSTDFVCELVPDQMSLSYTKNPLIIETIAELDKVHYSNASYREKEKVKQRLIRLSGKFIEVEVGSGLSKDAVRQKDAWQDAITSAQNAINGGIIKGSCLMLALKVISELETETSSTNNLEDRYRADIYDILRQALCVAVYELIAKTKATDVSSMDIDKDTVHYMMSSIKTHSGDSIPRFNLNCIDRLPQDRTEDPMDLLDCLLQLNNDEGYHNEVTLTIDGVDRIISTDPVETFGVFQHILRNSTTAMDIAMTPVVLTQQIMGNRI